MTRRWSTSVSGAVRLARATAAVREAGACLLLAPRRSVADEVVWRLAEDGSPTAGIERTTPGLLAAELASWALAREQRVPVAPSAGRAVLAQVVDAAATAGELEWFAATARFPGFVGCLQRTVDELRFAGIAAETLLEAVGGVAEGADGVRPVVERAHLRLLAVAGAAGARQDSADGERVLRELALLCRRYEAALGEWGLADSAWIHARAIETVETAEAGIPEDGGSATEGARRRLLAPWRDLPQIWLDVPLHSALEAELFAAVTSVAPAVTVTVAERDRSTRAAVRRALGGIGPDTVTDTGADTGTGTAADTGTDTAAGGAARDSPGGEGNPDGERPAPQGASSRLGRVQRDVFATAVTEPLAGGPADDPSFDFFSAAGEGAEAVEIARRILALAGEGVAFDDIAILVRQPFGYLPLVEDALGRAGIPAWFARGSSRPDPAGRAFLSLLACAAEGLSATRFAEYLSFDQVPDPASDDEVEEDREAGADDAAVDGRTAPEDVDVPWVAPAGEQMVLRTLVDAGEADESVEPFRPAAEDPSASSPAGRRSLRRSPRRPAPVAWERLIVDAAVVGGADRWRRRLAGLESELRRRLEEVEDGDEARRGAGAATLERLRALGDHALPLIARLDALPEGGSWARWLDALEELAVVALRRPRSVLELLASLRPMADVRDVGLRSVVRTLEDSLRFLEAEPPKRRQGRVFVGGIELARGRSFRAVFVPGLAEGVFPARVSEDPLLLDAQRRRISALVAPGDAADGPGEPTDDLPTLAVQSTRFHLERLLLRTAVGAASERLVVSYPRVDAMLGRARVPSFYALDVLRAAEGELPTLKELATRASAADAAGFGWPAPARPEDAIDDAEFDLSLLHPGETRRGAGRFLLGANPHLRRSLHARARRWRRPFTWADGLVADEQRHGDEVRGILAEQRPTGRSFSPTALQHFSACPYRFLLQAVHRLRPREDRSGFEQLDPLTRGSLFHDVQFRLVRRLRDEGLLPLRDDRLAEVLDLADGVLDAVAAEVHEEMAPAIDRVWSAEVESLRNDLRGWLRQVADEPGWRPALAELAFGLPRDEEHDEASVRDAVEVEGYRLRGSVDLVEVNDARRALRVTDHKTGRYPRDARSMVVHGGTILQPVLYALVAESMLGAGTLRAAQLGIPATDAGAGGGAAEGTPPEPFDAADGRRSAEGLRVESGRLFYCTMRGGFEQIEVPLNPEARRGASQILDTVDGWLGEGFLPAAPAEEACRYCDYRLVCGPYEERRIRLKQRRSLEPLTRLRKLR